MEPNLVNLCEAGARRALWMRIKPRAVWRVKEVEGKDFNIGKASAENDSKLVVFQML